jgi:hypothetical protein
VLVLLLYQIQEEGVKAVMVLIPYFQHLHLLEVVEEVLILPRSRLALQDILAVLVVEVPMLVAAGLVIHLVLPELQVKEIAVVMEAWCHQPIQVVVAAEQVQLAEILVALLEEMVVMEVHHLYQELQ